MLIVLLIQKKVLYLVYNNKQMENTDDPLEIFKRRMVAYNKPEAVERRKEIEKELLLIGKMFNLK